LADQSSVDDLAASDSSMRYRRLRVPRQNQAALHVPPLDQAVDRWQANRQRIADQARLDFPGWFVSGAISIADLQVQARQEVLHLAIAYSSRYLDAVSIANLKVDAADSIVMAGHQPELYHPGVWYKNFVLSEFASRVKAVAINLVVDSDLANQHSIRYPDLSSEPYRVVSIPVDLPSAAMPHEQREIIDRDLFESFAFRVNEALPELDPSLSHRIVDRLWPNVIQAAKALEESAQGDPVKFGPSIAAGRHRYENEIGLKTLELPVSEMANGPSFAVFAGSVFGRASEFCDIYNRVLADYRSVHRVRSNSHPVPALERFKDWVEVPFWIWQVGLQGRSRLFVKVSDDHVTLSDRDQLSHVIPKSEFVSKFRQLEKLGIAVRPRALMTTMFCRLFLSDVFLHGVGGAKYDQLTDQICHQFFKYQLPDYFTLSATMIWPTDNQVVRKADVTKMQVQRRERKFHPERFLPLDQQTPLAIELIKQKEHWTSGKQKYVRSLDKHKAIEAINEQLASLLPETDVQLAKQVDLMKGQLRNSEIAGSREYSFCLFDDRLVGNLIDLAAMNFSGDQAD